MRGDIYKCDDNKTVAVLVSKPGESAKYVYATVTKTEHAHGGVYTYLRVKKTNSATATSDKFVCAIPASHSRDVPVVASRY